MVNLRNMIARIQPEHQDSLSLFAAPIDMVIPVADKEVFWDKARTYKQDLVEAMDRGQWKQQLKVSRKAADAAGGRGPLRS